MKKKLEWFIKGRNKLDEYVEQKNSFGVKTWINVKSMKEELTNPIEKALQ